jgi:hypothetical protein
MLAALLVAASCGGSSRNSGAKPATTSIAAPTTTVDVAAVCDAAQQAAVDLTDALRNEIGNEAEELNHNGEIINALSTGDSAAAAKNVAALKEHTDKAPALASAYSKAERERTLRVAECRKALGGRKLSAPCEGIFTAVDHELTHLNEQHGMLRAGRQDSQDAIAALQRHDDAAAQAAVTRANQDATSFNDAVAAEDEAFKQVDDAMKACAGEPTATTSTTPAGPVDPALQQLASSFGCTDVKMLASKPDATATGSCTYRGEHLVISSYPASTGAGVDELRAATYCTPGGMAATAQTPTSLVASGTKEGSLMVVDIAKKLGGKVTLVMC